MSDNDPISEIPQPGPWLLREAADDPEDYFANASHVRTGLSAEVDAMYRIGNIFADCGRDAWPRIARWVMSRYGTESPS